MTETNEVQKMESTTPNQMIQLAIEGNADLEKLEKLLELQERYEANEARKVFASDFANVQSNIAAVVKTKDNPQTHSKYAGLDSVIEMSKPVYTKQGFSIIYYEGETEVVDNIRVCADVLHKAGHKETYHFDVPLDGVGIKGNANMTKIHGKASSVSYGRRYLLCMIWNIPTQDDDGATAAEPKSNLPAKPNETEQKVLDAICVTLGKLSGRTVLPLKVAALFWELKGFHPKNIDTALQAAQWLFDLKRESEWTDQAKAPSDKVDEIMENAFFEFETEHTPYLNANPDWEFSKKKFDLAVLTKYKGALPAGLTAAQIIEKIKPEMVAVKKEKENE